MPTGEGPQETEIPSAINRIIRVQIDHQKICMTATGYNQVLVMIDHFTKYAEAAPCMTASAEETCDHLINVWIARHGCPVTFQSDNGKAFVGDEGVNEKVAGSTGPLDHLSTANEWPSRKAESHAGIHVESLLLTLQG